MYLVASYAVYLAISLAVTLWVARTLHRNGRIFLTDAFHGNATLGDSINKLLVVAFCLVNIGNVVLALSVSDSADTPRQAIELITSKLGWVLVLLGIIQSLDLLVFSFLGRRRESGVV